MKNQHCAMLLCSNTLNGSFKILDGMCLLKCLPSRLPGPSPFLPESRDLLEKTLRCVNQTFTVSAGDTTIQQWQKWASEIAPSDDSVFTYVSRLGADALHIPLRYFLSGMRRYVEPAHVRAESKKRTLGEISDLPVYRAGA